MSARPFLACVSLVATLAGAAGAAWADDKADCEFFEISATKVGDKPVTDPELKPLEKKLGKPPFSSWNTFHVLSHSSNELTKLKPQELKLKTGSSIVLLRELDNKKFGLTLTMDDDAKKRVVDTKFKLEVGDWVVFGQQAPNNAGHLLALTCK